MNPDRLSPEERQEWAALYLLDALSAEEKTFFEKHLIEECREELRIFQETAAGLALSASSQEPPEDLRDRLLERLREREESEEN